MSNARTILLVEPNPIQRDAIQAQLLEAGFEIAVAEDEDEALAALGDHPDLAGLAVAWELPDGHCMKFLKRVLSRNEFSGGLVVFDCPKQRAAEDKLEEWADDAVEYVVLEAPSDPEGVAEALAEIVD